MLSSRSPKKNHIPPLVRAAIHQMVHGYGPERLALHTGQSPRVISNKANPNGETTPHLATVADLLLWMKFARDFRPLLEMCRECSFIAFPMPDLSQVSDAALLEHLARIGQEGGEFHAALGHALQDRKLAASEVAKIEAEAHEWIAAIAEGVARIKGMVDA